ncbi:hypothetical protein DYBT9275_03829 [Dyadobacter sp. CECT 9275]|uniref:Uncharacterized protein n=1 Tax=Dyadobacter helix TaxID=2822344 RepID=A0A916JET6_9BACT|nr:hypothetical protein DYBT9275_03829 [Dyadobacter sp. CECT 9275]
MVQIIPTLNKGGAERFVVDLCNELSLQKGKDIYLVSLWANEADTTFLHELKKDVHYITFSQKGPADLSVLYRLNKWLLTLKPDIVHTHMSAFEYIFPYRTLSKSTSFFHTIHSKAEKECPWKKRKKLRKYFFNKNTLPIAVSQDGYETYKSYYGLENAVVIENGRPAIGITDLFNEISLKYKNPDEYLLVHLGRIVDVKNQKLLIEAVQLFNKNSAKKCTLLIIGGIRDEILYQSLLDLCKRDQYIKFLGDKNNVADYLSIADGFCLSSIYEGMPMTIIEAFSVGCIPISTPVGGIPEMITHSVTGFLSKDLQVKSYYMAINECLSSESKESIKDNCLQEYFTRYSIKICGDKHWKLYSL